MKHHHSLLFILCLLLGNINLFAQQQPPDRHPVRVNTKKIVIGPYRPPVVGRPSDTVWRALLTYNINPSPYALINCTPYVIDLRNKATTSYFSLHTITGSIENVLFAFQLSQDIPKQPAYFMNPWEIEKPEEKLTKTQWDSIFNRYRTVHESANTDAVDQITEGFILSQEWFYDAKKQNIIVNIPSAAIEIKQYDSGHQYSSQDFYYGAPIGFKLTERADEKIDFSQTLYKPEIVWAKMFASPVFWWNDTAYKYSDTIDAKDLKSVSLVKYGSGNLEDWIFGAVKEGKIQAYTYDNRSIQPGDKLTKKGMDTLLTRWVLICDTCGNPERTPLERQDLAGMKVVQEILFNDKTFKFESKIIRVALLRKNIDEFGDERPGSIPILWVKFDQ